MRTHTQAFKDGIKQYGRQFNDTIHTGYNDGQDDMVVIVQSGRINRVNYSVDTTLLKSVMQTLEVELATKLDDRCKVLAYTTSLVGVNNSAIEFKNFNIEKVEEKKDTKSYIYTCYDNMIKAMVDYETPKVNGVAITYPITIRDYLIAICSHLGLTFKNASDTFTNYNKQVTSEHYIDADGNKMGYTFRDVLDDIAEAVGGFICIDNLGQLEIRYISNATSSKNLFNYHLYDTFNNTTKNNITLTLQNDGGIKLTGTSSSSRETNFALGGWSTTTTIIPLDSSKTYTISVKGNTRNEIGIHLKGVKNGTSTKILYASDTSSKATITGFTSISYISAIIYGNQTTNTTLYLQIEEGSQATTYEPYVDTINEDYFSDKNVNIGKKVGAYNTLVLSRASDSDNIHRPTTLPQEPIELKISDNAILDQDNREDFIDGIFNQINGLEFYLNDFSTTGILYYEIGDKYNVSIGDTIYPCLMLSDDIKRTTGLKENIVTKEPKQSVTDYKYSSTTDKVEISSRNAKILVDKANASIEQIVEAVGDNGEVTTASIVQSINDSGSNIQLNADKIYINGVTFDSNQKMTMTDGDIEITDNGNDTLNASHIFIKSSDDTKLNFLTSYILSISQMVTEQGTDYKLGAVVYPDLIRVYKQLGTGGTIINSTSIYDDYIILNRNNHENVTHLEPRRILLKNNNTTTFEVDGTTGDVTIGGNNTTTGYTQTQSIVAKEDRPSTPDFSHQYPNNKASMRFDICSSAMDSSGVKPTGGDGYLLTFFWDNSGQYDSQLFIPNGTGQLQTRFKNNGTWSSWYNVYSSQTSYDYYSDGGVKKYGYIEVWKCGNVVQFTAPNDVPSLAYGETYWLNLPAKYRPVADIMFKSYNNTEYVYMLIKTNGNVYLYNYSHAYTSAYNFGVCGTYLSP